MTGIPGAVSVEKSVKVPVRPFVRVLVRLKVLVAFERILLELVNGAV